MKKGVFLVLDKLLGTFQQRSSLFMGRLPTEISAGDIFAQRSILKNGSIFMRT